jgi:hypothetical protein
MQRELLTVLLCLVSFAGACSSGDGSSALVGTKNATGNRPPTISGSPPTSAVSGEFYSFTPSARDPEGRVLTFSIQRKPVWATFNTKSGTLSGSPRAGNVGPYTNIVIAVSDGKTRSALSGFTINVSARGTGSATLSWAPPTQNADGSTLSNLAGYRIYYGSNANSLDRSIVLNNPGLTRYLVEGLSSARWYFSMTSVDRNGNESRRSETVSKNVS